jgi:hypothetical protein
MGILVNSYNPYLVTNAVFGMSDSSGSTLFTTVDMTSGYHQVPVKESDIPKTAFVTKYGLYEFTKMPMGLKSGFGLTPSPDTTCPRNMTSD